VAAFDAGAGLDHHGMPFLHETRTGGGNQADAAFQRLQLAGNTNAHLVFTPLRCGGVSVNSAALATSGTVLTSPQILRCGGENRHRIFDFCSAAKAELYMSDVKHCRLLILG